MEGKVKKIFGYFPTIGQLTQRKLLPGLKSRAKRQGERGRPGKECNQGPGRNSKGKRDGAGTAVTSCPRAGAEPNKIRVIGLSSAFLNFAV